MTASKILIVEDEAPIREMIAFHLSRAGFDTLEGGSYRSMFWVFHNANGAFARVVGNSAARGKGLPETFATTKLHMSYLAAFPDSHIARKHGAASAEAETCSTQSASRAASSALVSAR